MLRDDDDDDVVDDYEGIETRKKEPKSCTKYTGHDTHVNQIVNH